jgi:Ca2+-transporting ATPase
MDKNSQETYQREINWHAIDVEKVSEILSVDINLGLSREEVEKRLEKFGLNEIREEKRKSPFKILLSQFTNILILILIIATVLSIFVGEFLDAITIIAIIIASATLGFTQEYKAEKAIEALKRMVAPTAWVIRDGGEKKVVAKELVPGDIVILNVGDKVPADIRLIEAINLKVDEAVLTGESIPVTKNTSPLPPDTPVSDRTNMLFSGTVITYGRGKGIVVATGMATEFGKIAEMVREEREEKTPLEKRMNIVGKWLGILSLSVAGLVAFLGLLRGYELLEMIIWGISLAIAAVPEALPAVVTGALAIGMYNMAKQRAIVRRLPAVETLGSTSVICSDKTGTMTKGEMTIRKIYVGNKLIRVTGSGYEPKGNFIYEEANPTEVIEKPLEESVELRLLLLAGSLCNDAKLIHEDGRWAIKGDPTEGAILVASKKAGLEKDELDNYSRVFEFPFSSQRKRMSTIHRTPDGKIYLFMKGAPEIVLERCKWIIVDNELRELRDEDRKRILRVNEEMAGEALRNLAIAYRELDEVPTTEDEDKVENYLVFLGLVGMMDPPRKEVKDAIRLCRNAYIKVIMITGDHKLTAVAVAKELGMLDGDDMVLTGVELEKMSDEELEDVIENVKIFARVSPIHKVRIVKALKKKGYIVAMTGDGVNDAPALKSADIGVAMGITGTEVTKEASDMVLQDDNFATIVNAVKEGRRIFDNIKKYLIYLLQANITEILAMLFGTLAALPLPLTAIQILWVNLVTDGFPAMALGVDPPEKDVMERKPRSPDEPIFNIRSVLIYLVFMPLVFASILIIMFNNLLVTESLINARTQLFTALVFGELAIAISTHSLSRPVIKAEPFNNKFLWIAILVSGLMQLAVLYIPQLHGPFDVTYPTMRDYLYAFIVVLIIFGLLEFLKIIFGEKE